MMSELARLNVRFVRFELVVDPASATSSIAKVERLLRNDGKSCPRKLRELVTEVCAPLCRGLLDLKRLIEVKACPIEDTHDITACVFVDVDSRQVVLEEISFSREACLVEIP